MGNCCRRCCCVLDRRKYLQSKYTAEQEFSIEFQTLMDEEPQRNEMTRKFVTLNMEFIFWIELHLLNTDNFDCICSQDLFYLLLAEQEHEDHRFAARHESVPVAHFNKERNATASAAINKACTDDEDWEVAGGDDDFEIFLASVQARSLAAQSQVKNGDAQSSSSSNAVTKEKSFTEGSSIDLSWDHETEVSPKRKVCQRVSEDSWSKPSTASPMHSSDLEWDPDFVSAEDNERMQLLNAATGHISSR
ncbi:unnamed protein product [Candidula unifasciata]|uniref:Uncharacterized protein n=1 Tax=Candidula unifasciata TaxID=100452 RepID=A0A8S3YDC7_9EUPU|nr:unnamed protein product [Candidula unifasciata]